MNDMLCCLCPDNLCSDGVYNGADGGGGKWVGEATSARMLGKGYGRLQLAKSEQAEAILTLTCQPFRFFETLKMQVVKNAVENALKGLLSSQAVRDEPKIGSTGQLHSQPDRENSLEKKDVARS